jgi:hypothetical protein
VKIDQGSPCGSFAMVANKVRHERRKAFLYSFS